MKSARFHFLEMFVLAALWIFVFLFFFHKLIEPGDLWWHLSTGRWIVQHHQVPELDVFPFAHEKTLWNNYEWLGSVFLYEVQRAGGYLCLKLLRPVLMMLAVGIFFAYSRRRLPLSLLVILTVILSLALYQRAFLRPDSFNVPFLAFFLLVLFSYESKGGRWKLMALLAAGVVWDNIHPGALFYGGALIAIFWLSAFLKSLDAGRGIAQPGSFQPRRQAVELAFVFAAYLASFIFNPYGLEGLLLPYKMLLFPQFFDFYKKIMVTSEFQPPTAVFLSFQYFFYLLLMFCPLAMLFFGRVKSFLLIVLWSVATFGFLHMIRNANFFAVVAAFVIARAAQEMGLRQLWSSASWSAMADRVIYILAALFLVLQIFGITHENAYIEGRKIGSLSLETNPYVVSSIHVPLANGLHGQVFNSSLLGGSLLWFGYPQLRPFNDSRDADKERFAKYVAVFFKPAESWDSVQREYNLNIAILNLQDDNERDFFKYFFNRPDWQLIALRGYIAVCVKRGAFRLPAALDHFEEGLKSEALTAGDIKDLKALAQRPHRNAFQRFLAPAPVEVDLYSESLSLWQLGFPQAGVRRLIGALRVSDRPDMEAAAQEFLKAVGQS